MLEELPIGLYLVGLVEVRAWPHVTGALALDCLFLKARLLRSEFLLAVKQLLCLFFSGVESRVV